MFAGQCVQLFMREGLIKPENKSADDAEYRNNVPPEFNDMMNDIVDKHMHQGLGCIAFTITNISKEYKRRSGLSTVPTYRYIRPLLILWAESHGYTHAYIANETRISLNNSNFNGESIRRCFDVIGTDEEALNKVFKETTDADRKKHGVKGNPQALAMCYYDINPII
jgi:hypothetical protein